jgi:hypothetical protein
MSQSIHAVPQATQPGWLSRFWARYTDMLDRNRRAFGIGAYIAGGWYLLLATLSFMIPDLPGDDETCLWIKFPFVDKFVFKHARRIAATWALVASGISLVSTGMWLRRER